MSVVCPLCSSNSSFFFRNYRNVEYYSCDYCLGIFIHQSFLPDFEEEKNRYLSHNNDVYDESYRKFVNPIVEEVLASFDKSSLGLDFGAGTGPVISTILTENGYQILQYDPFFHNKPQLLNNKYDYIVCCEVMEHFYHPSKEFEALHKMLNKGGKLICMTSLYNDEIVFKKWHYKDDPTHVFIYRKETIDIVAKMFKFSDVRILSRLIVFGV